MEKYERIMTTDGWKIYQSIIITIGNNISEYFMSKKFTELDAQEKDVQQRAFFMTKELFTFLLDPLKDVRKSEAIMQHNTKMQEATLKGRKRPTQKGS